MVGSRPDGVTQTTCDDLIRSHNRILIRIADEGEGFNREEVPDPTSDPIKMIEKREEVGKRPGGFGIHLVGKVMDSMTYNSRGNVVTLEKKFV